MKDELTKPIYIDIVFYNNIQQVVAKLCFYFLFFSILADKINVHSENIQKYGMLYLTAHSKHM